MARRAVDGVKTGRPRNGQSGTLNSRQRPDGLYPCSRCNHAYAAKHMRGNAKYSDHIGSECLRCVRVRSLAHNIARRAAVLVRVPDWCRECGEELDPVVAEFDHLPGHEKMFDIGTWVNRYGGLSPELRTIEALAAELKKGEWVHGDCHKRRTYEREITDQARDVLEAWVTETGAIPLETT